MLSTSNLTRFSLTPAKANDKLFRKHKFTHQMVSPIEHQKQQLCFNVA
jgi:hypothetical protein